MRTIPRGRQTTRLLAREVACPDCGAAAGAPCLKRNGEDRLQAHKDRHLAATR